MFFEASKEIVSHRPSSRYLELDRCIAVHSETIGSPSDWQLHTTQSIRIEFVVNKFASLERQHDSEGEFDQVTEQPPGCQQRQRQDEVRRISTQHFMDPATLYPR